MSWYKFVQDSTRERKFVRLPLSLYLLVHLCDPFDIVPHFLNHFGRGDYTNTLSQTAEPSIELWACLNDRSKGEVLFVLIGQHRIPAEAIQNRILTVFSLPENIPNIRRGLLLISIFSWFAILFLPHWDFLLFYHCDTFLFHSIPEVIIRNHSNQPLPYLT